MDYSGPSPTSRAGSFVISRSWSGNYVWKLQDGDGHVLETSTSRFNSYDDCRRAVERIKRVAAHAVIQENLVRHSRLPGNRLTSGRKHI